MKHYILALTLLTPSLAQAGSFNISLGVGFLEQGSVRNQGYIAHDSPGLRKRENPQGIFRVYKQWDEWEVGYYHISSMFNLEVDRGINLLYVEKTFEVKW